MRRLQAERLRGAVEALRGGLHRVPRGGPPLTGTESLVLSAVAALGENAYPTAIAESAGLRRPNVSASVADLRRRGLLAEARGTVGDGRRRPVTPTDAGWAAHEADREAQREWLSAAVASLLTPDERRRLDAAIPLLIRIARAGDCDQGALIPGGPAAAQ